MYLIITIFISSQSLTSCQTSAHSSCTPPTNQKADLEINVLEFTSSLKSPTLFKMPIFLSLVRIVETSIKTLQLFLYVVSFAVGFDSTSFAYQAKMESTKSQWSLDKASQTI